MELMESGLSRQLVGKVGWRELRPARMRCSIGFTCSQVRKLSWLWGQWMIIRRKRGGEVIHERMVRGTLSGVGRITTNRFGNLLKTKCLFGSQNRGGQNRLEERRVGKEG